MSKIVPLLNHPSCLPFEHHLVLGDIGHGAAVPQIDGLLVIRDIGYRLARLLNRVISVRSNSLTAKRWAPHPDFSRLKMALAMFDLQAAVHNHPEAGLFGLAGHVGFFQTLLHPHPLGPHGDGFSHDRGDSIHLAEDVHDLHGKGMSLRPA